MNNSTLFSQQQQQHQWGHHVHIVNLLNVVELAQKAGNSFRVGTEMSEIPAFRHTLNVKCLLIYMTHNLRLILGFT